MRSSKNGQGVTDQGHRDFEQQALDELLRDDLEHLVRLAMREDLGGEFDLTTVAIVPDHLPATAAIVSRREGVAAGVDLLPWIVDTIGVEIQIKQFVKDGNHFAAKTVLAELSGESRDILTCERTVLNFLGRLCGVATWTSHHVRLIQDLPAQLYDTRKTTPGWRRLEKYSVRCGGAKNHRQGLYDAVLIKDNHLACHTQVKGHSKSLIEAVERARDFLREQPGVSESTMLEIEVDSLEQLEQVLPATPDIILLDNMSPETLKRAVELRNRLNPHVQLEASGGVDETTLRSVAQSGVDRISMGGLTHSAVNLDLGLDWHWASAGSRG